MKEMWDQRFSAEDYYYGKDPNLYFKDKVDSLPPGRILLPAEGEGRNGVYAAIKGWSVTAVDFSVEGRRKALNLAKEENVRLEYLVGDITETDFGAEQFDAVGIVGGPRRQGGCGQQGQQDQEARECGERAPGRGVAGGKRGIQRMPRSFVEPPRV